MDEVKLYRKNTFGIGTWRVFVDLMRSGPDSATLCIAHAVTEGGTEVLHHDHVVKNGSGRTIPQQVELEMNSRVSKQLDKGYKRTRDEAVQGSTNQMGLINPMLAQKLEGMRIVQSHFKGAFVQPKLDGHRCLITKQDGVMLAYSRKGKPVTTINHVLEAFESVMEDGDTVDGEIYKHGVPLQSLSSLIKREQVESRNLEYHWYDICDRDKTFDERHAQLLIMYENLRSKCVQMVETVQVAKMSDVYRLFREHRDRGYEGSMLRLSTHGYQDGLRANQLVKVKERHDMEVTVVGGRPSATGWAILTVDTDSGVRFDVSAPGTHEQKTEVLQNIGKYVGRRLTIEYAMLTKEGVPFHAVAMRWHEEL